jgi:uncharacterized protein (UPF0179 family)
MAMAAMEEVMVVDVEEVTVVDVEEVTTAAVGLTQLHQCHHCPSAEDVAAVEEIAAAVIANIKNLITVPPGKKEYS